MDFILPIAAITALALFFSIQHKILPSASFMFAISSITVFLCLLGMINLLPIGVYIVYTIAVFVPIFLFLIKKYPLFQTLREFFSPGVVYFFVGVLFFFFVLKSKNAIFRDWDEFSFWGTAAKTVFYYDKLYTFVPVSFPLSYPPALPVFSYFTQFFPRSFTEYRTYVAYDVMIVAALAPMFSRIKFRNALAFLSAVAFSFIGIYAFFHASEGLKAYATSYSDMQIGFLFGGSLLMWFSNEKKGIGDYFSCLSVLLVITLCKDIGLAVSFIAAFIMAADMCISGIFPPDCYTKRVEKIALPMLIVIVAVPLFLMGKTFIAIATFIIAVAVYILLRFKEYSFTRWIKSKSKIFLRITFILFLFMVIFLVYRLWAFHYQVLRGVSRDASFKYSLMDVIRGKSIVFNMVLEEMKNRLFNSSIICFGTIFEMIIIFTVIPIILSVVTGKKKNILRISTLSVLLTLGFIVYYLFHAYLFATQFPNEYYLETTGTIELMSFNRYISSYAIGWLYTIVGMFFLELTKPVFMKKILTFAIAIAVSLALVISVFYYTPDNSDQYLLTSKKVIVSESGVRPVIRKHLSRFRSAFTNEDKMYFVSFSIDGGEWFCLLYEAFPALLQRELGYFVPKDSETVSIREVAIDRKGFSDYLRENNITMVYVNYRIDDYFLEEFAPLFEDGLSYTYDDSARVYFVVDEGGEMVSLVPIVNKDHFRELKVKYPSE